MFKKCANLPWWIVTLVHKMCLKVKGWILNIAQCLCWLIYLCVSKLVLAFLGELWTCFTKCAFNWKGEFWNTYAFKIRLGALESWFLIKNSGVADVTVHLALSKRICDRQIVIKMFVLGLESMVSSVSNLVKPFGPEAPWVWAHSAQTQGAST